MSSSFRDDVHRLAWSHLVKSHGRIVRKRSLLERLEAAVSPSVGGLGDVSGSGATRLPIDTAALDLLARIEREARDIHTELHGTPGGALKGVVRTLADGATDPEWQAYVEDRVHDWVSAILRIVEPPRVYRPSAPCPACGQRFAGENRGPALAVEYADDDGNMLHPADWTMQCLECGAEWSGLNFQLIVRTLARETSRSAS